VTAQLPAWLVALGFAVTMLMLGMRVGLLAKPALTTRCAACGRLRRRGRGCPCTRPRDP
jgi:hypothetical protein